MEIKGIIFDMDGTLLDTLDDLSNSVNYALEKAGSEKCTKEEIKSFLGNGVEVLIEKALKKNINLKKECIQYFLENYKNNSMILTKPYKNCIESLKILKSKGIKLAVLSNKIDSEVKKLSKYYFEDIFDISKGESKNFPKKPDKTSSEYIIKEFNLKKENVVFIGDSEVDIQTAENVGIECLSVCWGFKTKEFLIKNNAQKIFDSFIELCEYIIDGKQ